MIPTVPSTWLRSQPHCQSLHRASPGMSWACPGHVLGESDSAVPFLALQGGRFRIARRLLRPRGRDVQRLCSAQLLHQHHLGRCRSIAFDGGRALSKIFKHDEILSCLELS